MKKFGILLLSLCIATPALADLWTNCTNAGGNIITANSYSNDKGGLCNDPSDSTKTTNCNGKRFCMGGNKINWWSAFTWCESIGGKLASFEHVCPGVQTQPNNVAGACPNAKGIGSGWVWVTMGWQSKGALDVNFANGAIDLDDRTKLGYMSAVCEE